MALISPEVVISYPQLFTATLRKDAKPTDKPKFSAALLFTHDAVKTPEYKALAEAVTACAIEKWGKAKVEEMVREGVFKSPFLKDIGSKGYDTARFAVRVGCSSGENHPPAVIGRDGKSITEKREIYAGARVRVSLSARAYGGPGTTWAPGVSLDLRNVQKLGDGERLAGSASTGDEFESLEAEAGVEANLADLMG